jgi:hypothetical protein
MKTSLISSSIAFLLVAVTACGGGSSGDDDSTPPDGNGGGPSVTATVSPTSVAAGGDVTVTVSTENFVLEAPTGQANQAGHGHYHIYLDDDTDYLVADAQASVSVTIPDTTTPGAHTLRVELYNNDHSELDPEIADTIDLTVTAASNVSVTATANPTTVNAGSATTLTIAVDNFTLEAPTGQANQEGHGHYHVYLDGDTGGDYLAVGQGTTIDVTIPAGTSAGAPSLRVELHNNDHSAVTPTVDDVVAITVQ